PLLPRAYTEPSIEVSWRDCLYGGLTGTLLACDHHVGLEQHALQPDPLLSEFTKHYIKDRSGDLFTALNRMRTVHQHFRLDDRNESLFLTERGIPRQRVRIRVDAGGARAEG